jgi:hypothetical protein
MPRYVMKWTFWAETGHKDKHGEINVEKGRLKTGNAHMGLRVFRRRQRGNKNRYLYWTDADPTPRGSLGDVIELAKERCP